MVSVNTEGLASSRRLHPKKRWRNRLIVTTTVVLCTSFIIYINVSGNSKFLYQQELKNNQQHYQYQQSPKAKECGAASEDNRASILFDECFCNPGWKGENCSIPYSGVSTTCKAYDDRCFFHPNYGVARVSQERWKGAQAHEDKTWAEQRSSDRNDEHAVNFENYASVVIEGLEEDATSSSSISSSSSGDDDVFGDMIEFGAGPFTQSLTIFDTTKRSPKSITLLEPMAKTYMKTVHACRYKDGKLGNLNTTVLSYAAEELAVSEDHQFDTILLLNFIEHVMDAFRIYNIAFQALRPGGLVIFHERFWPGYYGKEEKNKREFDLHPIRLNERFAHWMATEFDLLYEKEQTVSGHGLFFEIDHIEIAVFKFQQICVHVVSCCYCLPRDLLFTCEYLSNITIYPHHLSYTSSIGALGKYRILLDWPQTRRSHVPLRIAATHKNG
mmetsp:Transcript_30772/g.58408  ORF Transcript_30772/g.58408 Transcript_30772/m.58408 type:complete len:442 (-) Transcript_30772:3363-4688(-)